jgi:lipopolysaccharide/colanic/teichoic acid biosynthesis glycosyltransferase
MPSHGEQDLPKPTVSADSLLRTSQAADTTAWQYQQNVLSPYWRHPLQQFLKRGTDIVGSFLLLVLLFPVLLLFAAIVKLTSPGPIFFRWTIAGRHGRPVVGYKFRSMFVGADKLREGLRDQNEMTGPYFKMKDDPRVTSVGRFLRRFSLDELPQLWSILKGDMSFVGPRPTQIFEFEQLSPRQRARNLVKPGAVSPWVVNGKACDFDEMLRSDINYIQNWSIWLDYKVMLKVVPYILFGRNN